MFELFYDPDRANELLCLENVQPVLFPIPNDLQYNEEFRFITNYMVENVCPYYIISNYGRLFDLSKNSYVYGYYDDDGYIRVNLRLYPCGRKNIGVHRLVLLAFDYRKGIDKDRNMVPNHLDGVVNNNNLSNLEWCTQKENAQHAIRTGLHKMYGTDNPNNKLSEDQVKEICKLIESGKYYDTEIAKMYNVSYTNISDIHKGKIWKAVSKDYNLDIRKPRALTKESVKKICELMQDSDLNNTEIAKIMNVSITNIACIRRGEIWKSISKDYNINRKQHT